MRSGLLASVVMLSTCAAHAHEFWIAPSAFKIEAGRPLDVSIFVGDGFPGEPLPRDPNRLLRFEALQQGEVLPIFGKPGDSPAGRVLLTKPGTATLVYRSNNTRIEMDAEKFEAYLREDGMEYIIDRRRERGESDRPGRELYSRCCKALVQVVGQGETSLPVTDSVVGLRHELILTSVTDADPATPGVTVNLRDIFNDAPLEGVMVCVRSPEAPGDKRCAPTNAQGEVTIDVPWEGMLLVSAVHMVEASKDQDGEWESTWTSLAFDPSLVAKPVGR